MKDVNIKELKKCHIKELLRPYIAAFSQDPWNDDWKEEKVEERLNTYLESPKFYGLYIEKNCQVIGGLLGNIKVQSDGYVYHLEEFFIDPNYQGLGYGKKLYHRMLADLKERGLLGVLFTTINNSKAYRMYISQGAFEIYDNVSLGHEL